MKHGKKPTVRQRKIMKSVGLVYENWLVIKDTSEFMEVVHKISRKTRRINKSLYGE